MLALGLVSCLSLGTTLSAQRTKAMTAKRTPIQTITPKRPAGQRDVLGLRLAPMPVVRVGFIGLGMRGPSAVERFVHLGSL